MLRNNYITPADPHKSHKPLYFKNVSGACRLLTGGGGCSQKNVAECNLEIRSSVKLDGQPVPPSGRSTKG
jgi:hypothetical protein